jgi:NADPH:quinone reductase-like Zn-dependent oxidoreductase
MKAMVWTERGSPDDLQLQETEKPISEHNQVLVKVIDYLTEDFARGGQTYDIIFEAAGKRSFSRCEDSLEPGGIYLATDPRLSVLLYLLLTSMIGSKKAIWTLGPERAQDLEYLTELIEAGGTKAVIDRRYPLERILEAHSYVQNGHTKGNVVITVKHNLSGNNVLQGKQAENRRAP